MSVESLGVRSQSSYEDFVNDTNQDILNDAKDQMEAISAQRWTPEQIEQYRYDQKVRQHKETLSADNPLGQAINDAVDKIPAALETQAINESVGDNRNHYQSTFESSMSARTS